jgi:Antibiotic biosynthesis monooxygenase
LRLLELWQGATERVMRHLPGFVAAYVHRSLDGTKVVNYAQWKNQEAFTAMPRPGPTLRNSPKSGPPIRSQRGGVSVHHV